MPNFQWNETAVSRPGVCAWQYANLRGLEMCTRRKGSSQLTSSSSSTQFLQASSCSFLDHAPSNSCNMFMPCEWNWLLDTCSCSCTATASRGFNCLILIPAQDRTVSAVFTELNNIASVLDAGIRI